MSKPETGASLGIQLTLPSEYARDRVFLEMLKTLQESGCDHVELNIPFPENTKPSQVNEVLSRYDLRCTNFATGSLYPGKKTSLSHSDETVREQSVESIKGVIRYCSEAGFKGLILGFAQGNDTKDRSLARELFKSSLDQLVPYAQQAKVTIVVEALNRFISNVCNTLDDTVELVGDYPKEVVAVLPDTYHMNIEESDMMLPLIKHNQWFRSIHFSENNRYFPGLGAIDFQRVYRALYSVGFTGELTIEGNVKNSWIPELIGSAELMRNLRVNEQNLHAENTK
ncbi:MAG: sugar phosphate isomerase/epimerase family protein [Sphaerochaeta sp.]